MSALRIRPALATDAPILLMDEPFSALDPLIRDKLQDELLALQRRLQKTIVFVSHDLAVVQHISHRVLVMYRGQLVEAASADEIYQNPQHDYTKKLLAAAA